MCKRNWILQSGYSFFYLKKNKPRATMTVMDRRKAAGFHFFSVSESHYRYAKDSVQVQSGTYGSCCRPKAGRSQRHLLTTVSTGEEFASAPLIGTSDADAALRFLLCDVDGPRRVLEFRRKNATPSESRNRAAKGGEIVRESGIEQKSWD